MELCGVPIRRARAQLIRTVQVGRVPLASRYTVWSLLPVPLAAALYRPSDDGLQPQHRCSVVFPGLVDPHIRPHRSQRAVPRLVRDRLVGGAQVA
jgi:hypothetical protein